jgi:hypothetical protein
MLRNIAIEKIAEARKREQDQERNRTEVLNDYEKPTTEFLSRLPIGAVIQWEQNNRLLVASKCGPEPQVWLQMEDRKAGWAVVKRDTGSLAKFLWNKSFYFTNASSFAAPSINVEVDF